MLRGTVRDQATIRRRRVHPLFSPARKTCRTRDPDVPLPDAVAAGTEPYLIVGAMAGG